MNANRNLCRLAAALMAIGWLTSLSGVALAEDGNAKYSLASLCGDYGAVVTYGANVAAGLGHEKYDGQGNATGAALANQPGPNGTRTITSFGISGTLHREQGRFRGQVLDDCAARRRHGTRHRGLRYHQVENRRWHRLRDRDCRCAEGSKRSDR